MGAAAAELRRRFRRGRRLHAVALLHHAVRRAGVAHPGLRGVDGVGLREAGFFETLRLFLGLEAGFLFGEAGGFLGGAALRLLLGLAPGDRGFGGSGEAHIGLVRARQLRGGILMRRIGDAVDAELRRRLERGRENFARFLRGCGFEPATPGFVEGDRGRRRPIGMRCRLIRGGGLRIGRNEFLPGLDKNRERSAHIGTIGGIFGLRLLVPRRQVEVPVDLVHFHAVQAEGGALGKGRRAVGAPAGAEKTREPLVESHQHIRFALGILNDAPAGDPWRESGGVSSARMTPARLTPGFATASFGALSRSDQSVTCPPPPDG